MIEVYLTNSAFRDFTSGKYFYGCSERDFVHENKLLIDISKYDVEIVTNFSDGSLEYKMSLKV